MKRVIASSAASNYETIFWSVYDSSYEVGSVIDDIIDRKGWEEKFFPEDEGNPTATPNDYIAVLHEFSKNPICRVLLNTVIANLIDEGEIGAEEVVPF